MVRGEDWHEPVRGTGSLTSEILGSSEAAHWHRATSGIEKNGAVVVGCDNVSRCRVGERPLHSRRNASRAGARDARPPLSANAAYLIRRISHGEPGDRR